MPEPVKMPTALLASCERFTAAAPHRDKSACASYNNTTVHSYHYEPHYDSCFVLRVPLRARLTSQQPIG